MLRESLKILCVRTSIEQPVGKRVNFGSGTVFKEANKTLVITAHHCIYGKELQYKGVSVDRIWIEQQKDFNSNFIRLDVVAIVGHSMVEDWALLEISTPEHQAFPELITAKNFTIDEEVHFRGFQEIYSNSSRPFKGTVLDTASDVFKITLASTSFNQASEDGAVVAKGLSGSGVFILENDRLYLIGILKSVIGDFALHDDIKCCPISKLDGFLERSSVDLSELRQAEKGLRNYHSPNSQCNALKQFVDAYNKEIRSYDTSPMTEYIDRLSYFVNRIEGDYLDVQEKLRTAGYETDIMLALRLKQLYAKQVQRVKHIKAAQKIHAYLLGRVLMEFHENVYVEITNDVSISGIKDAIRNKVVIPMDQLINSEENVLEINYDDLYGMIYYLTGNCHINWK